MFIASEESQLLEVDAVLREEEERRHLATCYVSMRFHELLRLLMSLDLSLLESKDFVFSREILRCLCCSFCLMTLSPDRAAKVSEMGSAAMLAWKEGRNQEAPT